MKLPIAMTLCMLTQYLELHFKFWKNKHENISIK